MATVIPSRAHRGQDGPAIALWQHDVQDDKVVLPGIGRMQPVVAAGRHIGHKAVLSEAVSQIRGSLGLVFHNEDLHLLDTSANRGVKAKACVEGLRGS